MTAVNAGRVELDIVAIAKDQVSATLRQVNAALAGTKSQMDAVKGSAAQGGGLGGLVASAKQGLAPVNSLREGFENIKSNILGLPLAVGGAVTAFAGLVSALAEADTAAEALKVNAQEYAEAIRGVVDWVKELRIKNGEVTKEEADAQDRRNKQQDDLRAATEKLLYLDSEIAQVKERQDGVSRSAFGWLTQSKSAYLEIKSLQNQRIEAEREIERLTRESAENIQRQATASLLTAGLRGAASGAGAGVETIDQTIAVRARRLRGGGRSSDAAEMAKRLYESQRAALDELAYLGAGDSDTGSAASGKRRGGLAGGIGGQMKMLADNKAAVAKLADEYSRLGSSIMGLAGPLGMLSSDLGKVTSALGTGLTAAAQFTSGDILGGVTSVLGGIIDLFGNTEKRARGIVRDAQSAMNGGPSTIIYNIDVKPGTDPQTVARSLRQTEYASRGTGRRAGGV